MFSTREIGIKLTLKKDSATTGLDTFKRDLRSWEKSIVSSVFNVRNAFIGLGGSMVFREILKNSKDLEKQWKDWKGAVMDSGVEDALKGVGFVFGEISKEIMGGTDSAKAFGDLMTLVVDGVAEGVIALRGSYEELGGGLDYVREKVLRLGAAALRGGVLSPLSTEQAEKFDANADLYAAAVNRVIAAQEAGTSPTQQLRKRWEDYRNGLDVTTESEKKAALAKRDLQAAIDAQWASFDKYNKEIEEYQENLHNADKWRNQWEKDDYYDRLIKKQKDLKAVQADQAAIAAIRSVEEAKYIEQLDRQQEAYEEIRDTTEEIYDVFANEIIAITNDWVNGQLKPARDYVRDIAGTLGNMALQAGMKAAFNVAFSAAASAFAAEGGIYNTAGAHRTRFMAGGGITDGPTIAYGGRETVVSGEAGPEAYVPLPGNRKIPVQMKGGTEGVTIVQHFHGTTRDEEAKLIARNGEAIAYHVQRAMQENPRGW